MVWSGLQSILLGMQDICYKEPLYITFHEHFSKGAKSKKNPSHEDISIATSTGELTALLGGAGFLLQPLLL